MSRTVRGWTREHVRPVAAVGALAVAAAVVAVVAIPATPTSPVPTAASAAPRMSAGDRVSFHRFVSAAIPAPTAPTPVAPAPSATARGIQFPGDEAGGYHRYIVELAGSASTTRPRSAPTVGPDVGSV